MSLTNIEIPDSLYERVQQLALEQQVTIDQFIAAAIDKEGYITVRASRADASHIPGTEPEEYDKL